MSDFVSSLAYKFLVGVAFTAVIIFSLQSILLDLHIFLGNFENGFALQVTAFTLIFILSAFGLFLLVKKRKKPAQVAYVDDPIASLLSLNLGIIGIKFLEGVISGLLRAPENTPED